MARLRSTGTLSSLSVRWAGWSPSWLVPLRATDDSRSKLSLPSGRGYSMGVHSLAGFSWSESRPAGGEEGRGGCCYSNTSGSALGSVLKSLQHFEPSVWVLPPGGGEVDLPQCFRVQGSLPLRIQ
jgi:hypothetical protein